MLLVPKELVVKLERVGERHVGYGATEISYFASFARCFIKAARWCSGRHWNEQVEEAWNQVISLFLMIMMPKILEQTNTGEAEEKELVSVQAKKRTQQHQEPHDVQHYSTA